VKLKLDENLGRRCIEIIQAAGHEVATDQGMTSASDAELIEKCTSEGPALITLDLDFSNPLVFPPHDHAGAAVLRLPAKPSHASLVALVRTLLQAIEREKLAGRLWSVEGARIRIYQPPDEK
jgi:predicted nuclease of predicted toxin-antitoxin system